MVSALANGPTSIAVKGGATNIGNNLNGDPGFINVVQPSTNTGTTPLAYLTVLFFDERFNLISASDGGAWQQQVASSVGSNGLPLQTSPGIKAPKNGYVFVYVSNQSNQDVYFDNLAVTISQGNIIEENHYYSFGLKIAAISSKKYADTYDGKINNPFQYNGKEMLDDDADLNWYDYGFRNYDPQIGRFMQLDPLTDYYPFLTPYQYASNDPVTNIDIDGLEGVPANAVNAGFNVAGVGAALMDNATEFGKTFHMTFSGFKTATGGAGKVAHHVVNKTATIIVKATQTGNVIVKTETTRSVGRDAESVCQTCPDREKQKNMATMIQQEEDFHQRLSAIIGPPSGPTFNQGNSSSSNTPKAKKDPYAATIIPNDVKEMQSVRGGDGFPIIGPLVQASRRWLFGISGVGSSFKTAGIDLSLSLFAGFKIEGVLQQIFEDRRLFTSWVKANQSLSRIGNPLNATEAQQIIDNSKKLGLTIESNLKGLQGLEQTGQWGGVPHFKVGNIHVPIQKGLENVLKF